MRVLALLLFLIVNLSYLKPSITWKIPLGDIKWPRSLWSGPRLTRSAKKNFKLLFVIGLIGIESSAEIFVRLPQEVIYSSKPRPLEKSLLRQSSDAITIIFPGAGGPDIYTDLLQSKIKTGDAEAGIQRYVTVYDW